MTPIDLTGSAQSLILSKGCQSLSSQGDTDWIFAFIAQHAIQPQTRDRDIWLFKRHPELDLAILIWCLPQDKTKAKDRYWVVVEPKNLPEEFEVLIFVKDSNCYTLSEYVEVEFGEEARQLMPDIVFPRH